jgi:hypothetical protein
LTTPKSLTTRRTRPEVAQLGMQDCEDLEPGQPGRLPRRIEIESNASTAC